MTGNENVQNMAGTECRCPATGEVLGYSPLHTEYDLKGIMHNARIAQESWCKFPIKKRARIVIRIRDYIVNHLDELAKIICEDNGKTLNDALVAEIFPATVAISFYCRNASHFLKEVRLPVSHIATINKRSKIIKVPWGLVAIISPWNYPFAIPFSEVVMALLAGNAVILKTATQTQLVGLALKKCFDSVGLPEGLFSFINIPGDMAGDMLLRNGVDKLFFTGSVKTGQYLMSKAAETLTPVSLELGGNDPMLICEDADLYRAAMGAIWGGFTNAGQSCGGVERIYVHQAIYEPFMNILEEKVEALKIGYGYDLSVDIGVMTTQSQIDIVKSHIEDALRKGAIIYAQSKLPDNPNVKNTLRAIVLTNVNHDMLIMRYETFGPVVGVMKVQNMEEAIALANDSDLGLTASVWSKDNRKAEIIARRIKAGVVNINDHLMSHGLPETPWGGFKKSGIGRTHGQIGFEEMTQTQVIIKDVMPLIRKNLWWPPNGPDVYNGIKGVIELWYAKSLNRRLTGMANLMKIIPRWFKED
jgi:succinate-semialdehyde dehydrogenase/glutarate-semialdehyde dehydrogenase